MTDPQASRPFMPSYGISEGEEESGDSGITLPWTGRNTKSAKQTPSANPAPHCSLTTRRSIPYNGPEDPHAS